LLAKRSVFSPGVPRRIWEPPKPCRQITERRWSVPRRLRFRAKASPSYWLPGALRRSPPLGGACRPGPAGRDAPGDRRDRGGPRNPHL